LVDPPTGDAETVIDALAGLPLNSPNDVVIHRDRTIWFTDPTYGFLQGFKPEPAHGDFVYRFDPSSGRLTVVASDFDKPNGLAFSPDGGVLYVGDSGANHEPGTFDPRRPHHIRAFDVVDGRLRNDRLFAVATPGFADRKGDRVVVAVVDAGGELIQLRRTRNAQIASSRVAVDKARTAAIFVRPSRELEAQVSAGRLGALALHGAVALTGGIPLVVDGEVVGAIGTSGETPDEDEAISKAGAAAA